MKTDNTLTNLVDQFAASVAAQETCIDRNDWKTGNRHARMTLKAFNRLISFGDPGREALSDLFAHPNASVRITAAAFLLRYKHKEALALLESEAKGSGFNAFTAGEAIARWNDGDWELDPG